MLVKLYIKKEGSEWVVYSEEGKPLGHYKTQKEAEDRLAEVEYFKHHPEAHAMSAPASPDSFAQAVAAFRNRIPVTDEEFDQLSEDLKPLAFRVASCSQADMVQQVYEALDSAIANGDDFETFKGNVTDALGDSWGEDTGAPSLETVFRTNVMTAYNDGRDAVADDASDTHEYFRFDAIHDDRTTDECEHLDGTVLPQDDAFWDSHRPPIHFNCRSVLTPLTKEDAQKEGINDAGPKVESADGFGTRDRDWQPDPDSYSPEIAGLLARRLSGDDNE